MSIRRIPLNVERLPDKISLGHGSENEAVQLAVDVSAWVNAWPACSISINFLRPYEDIFYTVSGTLDGGLYTYEVTDTDTAIAGTGTMEFVCTEGGKLAASAVARFTIDERLLGTQSPTPPEPVQSWYTRALQAADDAEGSAQRAETAAESIESIEPRVDALENIVETSETIEWNQLVQNGNFASADGWNKAHGSHTFSVANNEAVLTVSSTSVKSRFYRSDLSLVSGHNYFVHAEMKASANTYALRLYLGDDSVAVATYDADTWMIVSGIITLSDDETEISVQYGDTNTHRLPTSGTLSARNVWLADLTEMFGAGNEPQSEEEFREMFKGDYYPYDAGSEKPLTVLDLMNRQIGRLKHAVNELQPSGSPMLMSAPRMSMPQAMTLDIDGGDGDNDLRE